MVPKKFILEEWKDCKDKDAFEKYLREQTSICILTKAEDANIPKTKGRENFKDALKVYKDSKVETDVFCFDFEKNSKN